MKVLGEIIHHSCKNMIIYENVYCSYVHTHTHTFMSCSFSLNAKKPAGQRTHQGLMMHSGAFVGYTCL